MIDGRKGLLLTFTPEQLFLGQYTLHKASVKFMNLAQDDHSMVARYCGRIVHITDVEIGDGFSVGSIRDCIAVYATDVEGLVNGVTTLSRRLYELSTKFEAHKEFYKKDNDTGTGDGQ